jgi:hypothetical protein
MTSRKRKHSVMHLERPRTCAEHHAAELKKLVAAALLATVLTCEPGQRL